MITGEISNYTVCIFQIKYLKNWVVSSLILDFYNRVIQAGFFYCHIVLKYGFDVKTDPGIFRAGDRNFYKRMFLHILVDFLSAVGAEPKLYNQDEKGINNDTAYCHLPLHTL